MTDFDQYIGRFRIHSEVGHSPIAHKYRATDSRNGQSVALYILNADMAQNPGAVQNFLTIGQQAMRLRHAGIVQVLEADTADGSVYIATQWVREQALGERLRRSGRTIDIETAVYIMKGVATALDYAHSEGFTHGHITPDQIYVTNDNSILLDGFAEAVRVDEVTHTHAIADAESTEKTATHPLVFISPFIAPEQARAGQAFDFHSDIYSLGAVLYTMVTGRPPFEAEEPDELLRQIVDKQPPAPETINPALPPAIAYVLQAVLAKDPSARYGSAGEFAGAFLQSSRWNVTTTTELVTTKPERVAIKIAKPKAPNKRRSFAALLLILIVLALGFVISSAVGFGPLGNRPAQEPQAGQANALDRLRSFLLPPSGVAVELTANPAALTPTSSSTQTVAAPAIAASLGLSITTAESIASITPIFNALTNGITATATLGTLAVVTPTGTPMAPPTVALTSTAAVGSTSAGTPTLALDPLGLLTNAVTAGQVVVTGNAAPGTQIQLQIDGNTSGTTTTKTTGTWLFIVTLTEPREYAIAAQVIDANSNIIETAQQTITVTTGENNDVLAQSPTRRTTPLTTVTATIAATGITTVTSTPIVTVTVRVTVTPSATRTPVASATPTIPATVTPIPTVQPTATVTRTVTNTRQPTATQTRTPRPTATVTHTPTAAATATNTPRPTATITNTATRTPLPTATNTRPPTATHTPLPTATVTSTSTNTPLPTSTHTPVPTFTLTATATNTPLPTATNTPIPTATHTPLPTATNTPLPTATNTRPPTATNTPTVTNTPLPPPTATPAAGSIAPTSPDDGDSANGGQRTFTWSADFTPSEGYAFELVFWKPGQNPLVNSIGMAAPTTNREVTLDLERLDEQLGALFDTGEYEWGVLLVRVSPSYERVQYLGGGRRFTYYSGGGGGDSGSGGPSSGE